MNIAALWSHVNARMVVLGVVVFTALSWFFRRPKKLPPGPWGWPLLGNIPQLARIMEPTHQAFSKMGDRYGPVFGFKVANQGVVVLQDYDIIKQAMDQYQLSGRPSFEIGQLTVPGHGILTASGPPWVELRRFSLAALRKLGMGRKSLEEQISIEAKFLVDEIRTQGDNSFNPKDMIQNAVANAICYLVFGSRFEYNDAKFIGLLEALNSTHELGGAGGFIEFVPIFAKLTFLPVVKRHMAINRTFQKIMSNLLKDHAKGYQPEISRDYTDAFRNEMRAKESRGQPTYLTPVSLYYSVSGLFGAGTETTTSTLTWMLLYMVGYPDVQTKVQREIDSVVGRDRLPQLSDKPKLAYTQAGTIVIANLWHILNDPGEWTNPNEFRPERFMDSEGNLIRREKFIPFGIGRRLCLGESLAKMELFIFFSVLMHQFTFMAPEGARVSFEAREALTLAPIPYEVVAFPRQPEHQQSPA